MYQIEGIQSTREKMMSYGNVDIVTPLQLQQIQHPAQASWSSNSSLESTPLSPLFSTRQSSRFSSTTTSSSIASSPAIRSSLDGFSKVALAGVKEEKERETISAHDQVVSTLVEDIANREYLNDTTAFPDYDWIDTPPACEVTADYEFVVNKRRCPDASTTSILSSRFTGRFPSIAKKLRGRRENRSSSVTGSMHGTIGSRSRASSPRAPSIFDWNDVMDSPASQESIDLDMETSMKVDEEAEDDDLFVEVDRGASRTPLLPPVLTLKREEQIQSPLQSPSVDASPSLPQSPYESPNTFKYLPSPPLSTKPSVASFHHRTILPSAEIPIINLSETQDEWSTRLGHGNFTIAPEPYQLQAPVTLVSCQRLKADWELARSNFRLHIERTGQVYSETSKTYYLTQAKWNEINLKWRSCYEQALGDIPSISQEALQASFHSQDNSNNNTSSAETTPSSPITSSKEGKFPTLAASGIVGPMEQVKPMITSTRGCRKRSFWKFLQGVWPSGGFGMSQT